jgi:hypothetical protein
MSTPPPIATEAFASAARAARALADTRRHNSAALRSFREARKVAPADEAAFEAALAAACRPNGPTQSEIVAARAAVNAKCAAEQANRATVACAAAAKAEAAATRAAKAAAKAEADATAKADYAARAAAEAEAAAADAADAAATAAAYAKTHPPKPLE